MKISVIELTKTTANIEIRTAAVELFHAAVLFTIGRYNKLEGKVNFANVFKRLFPEMLRLASDIQQVPRSIFEPLCHQTVRWLAISTRKENPEVTALLDSLLAGAADKSNATLREHCAVCIAEYFDWHTRHIPQERLKDNPQTIKSLISKIQSFAIHPDPFKQLASILCFDKLLVFLQNDKCLVDLYIMDITISIISALKLADQSLCENSAKHLGKNMARILRDYRFVLLRDNEKRKMQARNFGEILLEASSANAELCRLVAQQLWVSIVYSEQGLWLTRYGNRKVGQSTKTGFTLIEHVIYSPEIIATYLKAEKFCVEKFEAQVQCTQWFIKNKFVDWDVIPTVIGRGEFAYFNVNVVNFFKLMNECKDIQAREIRNPIIRHNVVAFINLMELFGLLMEQDLLNYLEKLEITESYLIDTLLVAITDPHVLDLELGAPEKLLMQRYNDVLLETLRRFCKLTDSTKDLLEKINELHKSKRMTDPSIEILDIPANRLLQICLGHLELYRIIFDTNEYIVIPESVFELFTEQRNNIILTIENVISQATPQNVRKIRIILKYLLHLGIPYAKLEQWLIHNPILYQYFSNTLIDYILGIWNINHLPSSLIQACKEKKKMLVVLLPVLKQIITTNKLNYINAFYDVIPEFWNDIITDIDYIINELKIYQIIIGVSRTRLLNSLYTHSGKLFLNHCLNRTKEFLKESYSVMIKKEALLLAAEGWQLIVEEEKTFEELLTPDLKEVQKQYFPIKTTDLEKSSKGAVNFEIILDSFINIFAINLNYNSLSWLFLVFRESISPYLVRLQDSLAAYIQKIVGARKKVFEQEIKLIYTLFANPEVI
jgi:hypothetical protein